METFIPRHLEPTAREALTYSPGLIIEGARQVGKSTLASHLVPDGGTRITLDDLAVRDAARADPEGIVSRPGPILIDEIQHAPELTFAIKASIDRDRRPGRFILTGSASLLRVRGLTDSLAGRVRRLMLFGLSQGEYGRRRDDLVTRLLDGGVRAQIPAFSTMVDRADYAQRLVMGSYPEPSQLPPRPRRGWYDDYVLAVIGRDLSTLRRQVQPDRALALLRYLAARQSEELVKSRAATDVGIAASTADHYLDLLRDVHLFQAIPPWTPNLAKREIGRGKILIHDTGLAMRLAGVTEEQLAQVTSYELFGHALEGFVAGELLRQLGWSETEFRLFHYRDRAGAEVDLVIETSDGRVVGIDVKASTSYQARQFDGLKKLQAQLGDRFVGGFVLGTSNQGYRYAPGLWGLPIAALWEL